MSFVTRCPACATMFKVVADQLKISQGWVRCGQCAQVFEAALHLQGDVPAVARLVDDVATIAPNKVAENTSRVSVTGNLDQKDAIWSASMRRVISGPTSEQWSNKNQESVGFADLDVGVGRVLPEVGPSPHLSSGPDVSFVRQAQRRAFWHSTWMRLSLAGVSAVLFVTLIVQVAIDQRDWLAAVQPKLTPGLNKLCTVFGCVLGPLRRIDEVVIDGSSFTKAGPDAYQLSLVLKNAGMLSLATPALELTLLDAQNQAVLRRVLTPQQLGAATELAAGAEFANTLVFKVLALPAGIRVAGYRIWAFYP